MPSGWPAFRFIWDEWERGNSDVGALISLAIVGTLCRLVLFNRSPCEQDSARRHVCSASYRVDTFTA